MYDTRKLKNYIRFEIILDGIESLEKCYRIYSPPKVIILDGIERY